MPSTQQIRDAVLAEIESAFAGLSPPGDDRLLHPDCRDDGDIAAFYGGPRWQDLAGDFIVRNYAAPSFFSAEAFRFYLPAFMVWALKHPDSPDYVIEATLRAFDPGAEGEPLQAFQASKFSLFTPAQRAAVAAFLEAFRADPLLGPIAADALKHWP